MTGLGANPTGSVGSKVVKPSDTSLHQAYTFYIRASNVLGLSEGYFGPYIMNIGCFTGAVTYSDSGSLVTSVSVTVGDSTTGVYTFANPSHTRTWCTP